MGPYQVNDFAYATSRTIQSQDFDVLLFALIAHADTTNLAKLRLAFPGKVAEMTARYEAPGGQLPEGWQPPADSFSERFGQARVTAEMPTDGLRWLSERNVLRPPSAWEAPTAALLAEHALRNLLRYAPAGKRVRLSMEWEMDRTGTPGTQFEPGEPVSMEDPEIKAAVADAIAQADADKDSPAAVELRGQIAEAWADPESS
jgi:hypothetical protein